MHGPLIRDEEVEAIATFLREQGSPNYVEEVTEDVDGNSQFLGGAVAESADSYYDEAIALVARKEKPQLALSKGTCKLVIIGLPASWTRWKNRGS